MPKQRKKAPYNATIRFRAFKRLEEQIDRIIDARGYGDPADFMREGLSKIVLQEEARLGLPPLPITLPAPVKYSKASILKKAKAVIPRLAAAKKAQATRKRTA